MMFFLKKMCTFFLTDSVPNKKVRDDAHKERIKGFFDEFDNFKIRDVKIDSKLEVTLKTSDVDGVMDLEKLYLASMEGSSVVFKSKILDKGSHSGVIIDTEEHIIWVMTAKEFSEMENLMQILKNAKELAQLYSLLEKYKPKQHEVCYMLDSDYLTRYVFILIFFFIKGPSY